MLDWIFLGEGTYNKAYKSNDGLSVLKIQKNSQDTTDRPERSVRLWNQINGHLKLPPAKLGQLGGKDGWVCPFISGTPPTDAEIAAAVITIFNNTGRIILDASARNNFIKTNDGQIVCIDIGMALDLDYNENQLCSEIGMKRSVSSTSLVTWAEMSNSYYQFFKNTVSSFPTTVKTVKALLYIKNHRPDIFNADCLKDEPGLLVSCAKKYDEENNVKTNKIFVGFAFKELNPEREFLSFISYLNKNDPELLKKAGTGILNMHLDFSQSDVIIGFTEPTVATHFADYLHRLNRLDDAKELRKIISDKKPLYEERNPLKTSDNDNDNDNDNDDELMSDSSGGSIRPTVDSDGCIIYAYSWEVPFPEEQAIDEYDLFIDHLKSHAPDLYVETSDGILNINVRKEQSHSLIELTDEAIAIEFQNYLGEKYPFEDGLSQNMPDENQLDDKNKLFEQKKHATKDFFGQLVVKMDSLKQTMFNKQNISDEEKKHITDLCGKIEEHIKKAIDNTEYALDEAVLYSNTRKLEGLIDGLVDDVVNIESSGQFKIAINEICDLFGLELAFSNIENTAAQKGNLFKKNLVEMKREESTEKSEPDESTEHHSEPRGGF